MGASPTPHRAQSQRLTPLQRTAAGPAQQTARTGAIDAPPAPRGRTHEPTRPRRGTEHLSAGPPVPAPTIRASHTVRVSVSNSGVSPPRCRAWCTSGSGTTTCSNRDPKMVASGRSNPPSPSVGPRVRRPLAPGSGRAQVAALRSARPSSPLYRACGLVCAPPPDDATPVTAEGSADAVPAPRTPAAPSKAAPIALPGPAAPLSAPTAYGLTRQGSAPPVNFRDTTDPPSLDPAQLNETLTGRPRTRHATRPTRTCATPHRPPGTANRRCATTASPGRAGVDTRPSGVSLPVPPAQSGAPRRPGAPG